MVFMGSEAFPDENEYDAYLQQHGGSSNAYTDAEETVFSCDVHPGSLAGALQRFAAQFVAPLCAEGASGREVQAVESEFQQAMQSDGSRLLQVQSAAAPPRHPSAIFGWGNAESLERGPAARAGGLRPALLAHHARHYTAQRMTLVVLGAQPLDELQAMVVPLFSSVPAGAAVAGGAPDFGEHGSPLAPTHGCLVRLPSVKEAHSLTFTFSLPPMGESYLAKPEEYASHLLGHEGPGSLLSALKARGLATDLSAGVAEGGHERSSAGWQFSLCCTLTEAGAARWADTARLVFAAARLLRQAGPLRWVWEELAAIKALEFRFAEEEEAFDYVTRLAASAPRYAPEHAVAGEALLTDFDPGRISGVLELLMPHNCRIDFQSSAFAGAGGEAAKLQAMLRWPLEGEGPACELLTERWMGVPYSTLRLPPALMDAWAAAEGVHAPDLALPPRNEFIPTDFALVGAAGGAASAPPAEDDGDAYPPVPGTPHRAPAPPARLGGSAGGARGWHKLDGFGGRFGAPRAALHVAFTASAAAAGGGAGEALTWLGVRLAEEALAEVTYLADVAGLRCSLHPDTGRRFELKLEGFSHKLPALAQTLFASLGALAAPAPAHADDAVFGRVREKELRRLQNALIKPAKHAAYLRLRLLRERGFALAELVSAVEAATPAGVAQHMAQLLASASAFDALLVGNVGAAAAEALLAQCAAALPAAPGARPSAAERALRIPPRATALLFDHARNGEESNSALEAYWQLGEGGCVSAEQRAVVELAAQLLSEPLFDVLRTKEQLGYTVQSGVRETHGALGWAVTIVSDKAAPAQLEARLEAFLAAFREQLADMPADQFERNRASVVAARLRKDRALGDEAERHWEAVWDRSGEWGRREAVAAAAAALSQQEVLVWFDEWLAAGGASRRRLVVHVAAAGRAEEARGAARARAAEAGTRLVEGDDEAAMAALKAAWGYCLPTPELLE